MLALLLALLAPAEAADWITLNNTERGKPEGQRLIGFVQPRLSVSTVGEVDGLTGGLSDYNGEVPLFNRAHGPGPIGIGLQRARLGARGTLGHESLSSFLLLELGDNGLTREAPVVVTDASVSWVATRGLGVRMGLQKMPLMEETYPAVPVALEWVNFSTTALKLTGENLSAGGQWVAPFSAFRDTGAQLFGVAEPGVWSLGYAAMVGQGVATSLTDVDRYKDVSGRVQLARVLEDSKGPFRKEISLVVWGQTGGRDVDDARAQRTRAGVALRVETGSVWVLAEGVTADGVVELGFRPPFPGSAYTVAPDGRGRGAVVGAGVRKDFEGIGRLGVKARYDQTSLWTDDASDRRRFRTVTGGLELDPQPKLRLLATYEHRLVTAPDGAEPVVQLLDQVGDRFDLQVTARL